jgi:hypothetical protein
VGIKHAICVTAQQRGTILCTQQVFGAVAHALYQLQLRAAMFAHVADKVVMTDRFGQVCMQDVEGMSMHAQAILDASSFHSPNTL